MSDTTTEADQSVTIQHGGRQWVIPTALIALQREFFKLDAQMNDAAFLAETEAYEAARAKRLEVVLAKDRHAWLRDAMGRGERYKADQALRAAARA